VTTFEPGASEVFTQGLVSSPLLDRLLGQEPAASITDGLEVLVQLVMAAITTEPCLTLGSRRRRAGAGARRPLSWA
jgi:hypothetical protein